MAERSRPVRRWNRPPHARWREASPALAGMVGRYEFADCARGLAHALTPEWASILISPRGMRHPAADADATDDASNVLLVGPSDHGRQWQVGGGPMIAVRLTPLGWVRLIGGDASRYANRTVPLADLLPAEADRLVAALAGADDIAGAALLDDALARGIAPPRPGDLLVQRISDVLAARSIGHVADLALHAGLPQRTLNRICLRAFGFSPVRLIVRQRLLRTIGALHHAGDRPLSELIDPGYYDQAHFNRDFMTYMGMTPMTYRNRLLQAA